MNHYAYFYCHDCRRPIPPGEGHEWNVVVGESDSVYTHAGSTHMDYGSTTHYASRLVCDNCHDARKYKRLFWRIVFAVIFGFIGFIMLIGYLNSPH